MPEHKGFLNSNLTAEIMLELRRPQGASTASKIAENIDKSRPSISRAISNLASNNFLNKESKGRQNHYTINYSGIAEYTYSKLDENEDIEPSEKKVEWLKALYEEIFRNRRDYECLYDAVFYYPIAEIEGARNELARNEHDKTVLDNIRKDFKTYLGIK
jgi:predicted transcriptional regulator